MPLYESDVVLGRYHIEALLGEGGMGAVYRAFDSVRDQPCALKEFRLGHLPSEADLSSPDRTRVRSAGQGGLTREKAAEQFKREAKLLMSLDHPHLPKVSDYFAVDGECYLVMTLVEGQNLAELLASRAGRPLSVQPALAWMDQVMDALAYCHAQGVIHRDVKPANIIVTAAEQAFLVDFGIAKPDDPSSHTTAGARATTPGYSPPEQYGHARTDARSDIYALGATLYALLTGRDPVEAIDRLTTGAELPAPRSLVPGIAPHVDAAVMRALALKPADRFSTVGELRAALAEPEKPEGEGVADESEELWALREALAASHWPLILYDTFTNNAHNWDSGESDDEFSRSRQSIGGHSYRWEALAYSSFHWWCGPGHPAVSDVYLTAEAKRVKGPEETEYGLVFRQVGESQYVFGIRDDGQFACYLQTEEGDRPLIDWSPCKAIEPGGTNRLIVVADGDQFLLFVNDHYVGVVEDRELARGQCGLCVSLGNAGDRVAFEFTSFELRGQWASGVAPG